MALALLSGVPSENPPPGRAPLCPLPCAPRSLTQRRADQESQQCPHDCAARAAPLSRATGINSRARGGGTRRRLECPRERAGAAAAALGPARGGRGGARPPRSGYRRGPSPGARRPGIPAARVAAAARAAALTRAAGRIHQTPRPRPLRLGRSGARARAALSCALQPRRRPGREEGEGGGGMNHRGGRARPPSLCRSGPGGARRTGLSGWRREHGFWAWARSLDARPLQALGSPNIGVWERYSPRITRGLRGRFGGRASEFKL